jgi:hypothetical protein
LPNFSKEFYHWLAVCHNEAQRPAKRSSALKTKIQKVNNNEALNRAVAR